MKTLGLLSLLILVATAAFVTLNWDAFVASTTLSLGVANIQAPLGLVLLGMLIFVSTVFVAFLVYLQTTILLEARRHGREQHASRELADKAEASRFTELRSFLDAELKRLSAQHDASNAALLARVESLDRDLRLVVEQSGNTIGAYIGELEDRLQGPGSEPK